MSMKDIRCELREVIGVLFVFIILNIVNLMALCNQQSKIENMWKEIQIVSNSVNNNKKKCMCNPYDLEEKIMPSCFIGGKTGGK